MDMTNKKVLKRELQGDQEEEQEEEEEEEEKEEEEEEEHGEEADEGAQDEEDDDRTLKSGPDEPTRLWPLVCYELSVSVDQEEKILSFCKCARESVSLPMDRRLMADATKMVSNMKRGVLTHGQSTVGRSENLFLSTLSADQSAKYFKWYDANVDRLKKVNPVTIVKQEACEADQESSLSDICKRLQDVLKIPSNEHMTSPVLQDLEPATFDGHQFE